MSHFVVVLNIEFCSTCTLLYMDHLLSSVSQDHVEQTSAKTG